MKKEHPQKIPFINKIKEQEKFLDHFKNVPKNILFIYGPKSTGKTTLFTKIVKKLDKEVFAVSWMSMRGNLIKDFKDFRSVFFPQSLKGKMKDIITGVHFNLSFFGWSVDDESLLKENVFALMLKKLHKAKEQGKKPVIIIDEFQYLKNIFLDDEKEIRLVDELFKFFIEITKVYHLAHVVCLTSDSYYIEELYTQTKLSNTSDFQMVDHLKKEDIYYWLGEKENCPPEMVKDVWENIGGSVWEIWQIFVDYKNTGDWENRLNELLQVKFSLVMDYFEEKLLEKHEDKFLEISKILAEKGKYEIPPGTKGLAPLIKELVSIDIWFYDTVNRIITPNSESIRKALQRMFKELGK
jgi:AAA+ ATPase superfamily predicted ATPase